MSEQAVSHEPHGTHEHVHSHNPFHAHHFDTPKQQFDAGKFGMWLFLVQEVLFFSGLFVAYAVYRVNHPDIFEWGHQFLDVKLGFFNTLVLLFSSVTAAWAVRCAQLKQRTGLIACLVITLACAGIFLGVKYVEYTTKFSEGLYWSGRFDPDKAAELLALHGPPKSHGSHASHEEAHHKDDAHADKEEHHGEAHAAKPEDVKAWRDSMPANAGTFFSIYFCMSGLHAIHVIAGIIAISWILVRAMRNDFGPDYFGPVDYVALYWHLVDLVWIYLFPMLYLID